MASSPKETFMCECEPWMRPACEGLPYYGEHGGKKLCALHLPSPSKTRAFNAVMDTKIRSGKCDFQGTYFPDHFDVKGKRFDCKPDFTGAHFSRGANFAETVFSRGINFMGTVFGRGAGVTFSSAVFEEEADFSSAVFSLGGAFKLARFKKKAKFQKAAFHFGAIFEQTAFEDVADFSDATFPSNAFFMYAKFHQQAYFNNAVFAGEGDFEYATFHAGAYFFKTSFKGKADFSYVTFEYDVEFNKSSFQTEAIFSDAHFKGYGGFWGYGEEQVFGKGASAKFQYARFEEPRRFYFHTLTLRPHWFVNVDVREFDFTNVEWRTELKDEVKNLKEKDTLQPHRLLAITYRHLAVNAEENHRYEEASRFRYLAMDARRREKYRGLTFWTLGWWYWVASGYGERIVRASAVLLAV
jgi:uncharacterized protein YjbI with pentapeptide repeats